MILRSPNLIARFVTQALPQRVQIAAILQPKGVVDLNRKSADLKSQQVVALWIKNLLEANDIGEFGYQLKEQSVIGKIRELRTGRDAGEAWPEGPR